MKRSLTTQISRIFPQPSVAIRILLVITFVFAIESMAQAQSFSTTTVSASANPSTIGQSVTLTAAISATGGEVTGGFGFFFFDGSEQLNADPIAITGGGTSGTATFTVSFSTPGPHTILGSFSGTSSVGSSFGTLTVNVSPASSGISLNISPNPSPAGENVTMTASVTATGGNVMGGLGVSFFDGSDLLGTVPVTGGTLEGTATLTVPFSTTGSRIITAAFNGTETVGASNTMQTLTVGTPTDSLKLRAVQIAASRQAALNSGRAFSGAVETAVTDGLAGRSQGTTFNGTGFRMSYGPETTASNVNWPTKAQPAQASEDWQLWADFRAIGVGEVGRSEALSGLQFNGFTGFTSRVSPDFLVGVIAGYERFGYDSETLNAKLDGDGWTIGGYAGGKIASAIRYHVAAGFSRITYDGSAGKANGTFDADRWIVTSGLAGDVAVSIFRVEPSANVFGVWEQQEGYVDSLGTSQAARSFKTGRFSTGAKVSYPILSSSGLEILPYAGLYADYVFESNTDELAQIGLVGGAVSFLLTDGWSARAIGGVAARFDGGGQFSLGAEFGGLGGDIQTWMLRTRVNLPF